MNAQIKKTCKIKKNKDQINVSIVLQISPQPKLGSLWNLKLNFNIIILPNHHTIIFQWPTSSSGVTDEEIVPECAAAATIDILQAEVNQLKKNVAD